jgi:ABC-2 type transport system ATP-binding protein
VERGQIIGLLGLNGAGKTTTIRMIATLLAPTSGRVVIDGLDAQRNSLTVRRMINVVVGGERNLYYRLTGAENLWYYAQLYGLPPRQVRPKIRQLLDLVGLTESADLPVERYSRGMKQRLHIARGLINDPAYLLMDEPTLGLDAPTAKHIRAFVRDQASSLGRGILLTSHYMHEVEELCRYVYVIDRGLVRVEGTPEVLKRLTGQRYAVQMRLGDLGEGLRRALEEMAAAWDGRVNFTPAEDDHGVCIDLRTVEDHTPEVLNLVAASGSRVEAFQVTPPTLEDAILALGE